MNIDLLKYEADKMRARADIDLRGSEILYDAVRHITNLEYQVGEYRKMVGHLKKVCDDNRWPYDKEK